MSFKKPLTPFFTGNPFADAKIEELVEAGKPKPPTNEAEAKRQAEQDAARRALARADMPLYSTTLHGY